MAEIINIIISAIGSLGTVVALGALFYEVKKTKAEKKEEQANIVATWFQENKVAENNGYSAVIVNNSLLPIYDVVISVDDMSGEIHTGEEDCYFISILPPGKYVVSIDFQGMGMNRRFNTSITFRDFHGKYWTRNSLGILCAHKGNKVISQVRKLTQPYREAIYVKAE